MHIVCLKITLTQLEYLRIVKYNVREPYTITWDTHSMQAGVVCWVPLQSLIFPLLKKQHTNARKKETKQVLINLMRRSLPKGQTKLSHAPPVWCGVTRHRSPLLSRWEGNPLNCSSTHTHSSNHEHNMSNNSADANVNVFNTATPTVAVLGRNFRNTFLA